MKIAFDVYGSGLGNNGGSRTIVRSANELVNQGHEIFIFSHMENRYTWDDLQATHIILEDFSKHPKIVHWPYVDVLIATACTTASHVHKSWLLNQATLPVYWIRGIELWNWSLDKLIETWNLPLHLMVNSEWQRDFIGAKTRKNIRVQYPGLEFGEFYPDPSKRSKEFLKVGGLYHLAKHKGWKDFFAIANLVRRNNPSIIFEVLANTYITGSINRFVEGDDVIKTVFVQPSPERKVRWYQSCDMWLATTHLDGLHLPPMEAGLCGATLIANSNISSGMRDHADDEKTSFNYNGTEDAVRSIEFLSDSPEYRNELNVNHRELLVKKMGSRGERMREMVEWFEEKNEM